MWARKATEIHAKIAAQKAQLQPHISEQQVEPEIQIQHIIYDEAHKPPVPRRGSVSRKTHQVKIYISRLSCNSEKCTKGTSNSSPRSISSLRSGASPKGVKPPSKASSWGLKERQRFPILEKETVVSSREASKSVPKAKRHAMGLRKKGAALATAEYCREPKKTVGVKRREEVASSAIPQEHSIATVVPITPLKGKLREIVKEKWSRGSASLLANSSTVYNEKEPSMEKIHDLRKRIQDGKMERVIRPLNSNNHRHRTPPPKPFAIYQNTPPGSRHSLSIRPAPPPPPPPRKSDDSTQIRRHSRNRKTKSTSSTIASLFESGVDALDETRRGLQDKLRPSFEHIKSPSSSLNRKVVEDEDRYNDSDDSFYCAGEREPGKLPTVVQNSRGSNRRISVSSSISRIWEEKEEVRKCRVCGELGVKKFRNLCNVCEGEFQKRKVRSQSRTSPDGAGSITNEYTSPSLKGESVRAKLLVETSENEILLPSSRFNLADHRYLQKENMSRILPRSKARYLEAYMAHTPIIRPKPYSPSSQYSEIEIWNGEARNPNAWFSKRVEEDEFETTQSLFKRWSESFADSKRFDEIDVGKSAGLSDDGMTQERDSEFYRFWDELLVDPEVLKEAENNEIAVM